MEIKRKEQLKKEELEYKNLQADTKKSLGRILEILKTKGVRCGMVGLTYDANTKDFKPQTKLYSPTFMPKKKYIPEDDEEQMELPF